WEFVWRKRSENNPHRSPQPCPRETHKRRLTYRGLRHGGKRCARPVSGPKKRCRRSGTSGLRRAHSEPELALDGLDGRLRLGVVVREQTVDLADGVDDRGVVLPA